MATQEERISQEEYDRLIAEEIQKDKDFRHFAPKLRILTFKQELVPFIFNPIQELILRIRDDVVMRGLFLRFLLLKARREGMSTLFEGLYYHATTHTPYTQALTLAHEPEACDTLFQMVNRFHDNMIPDLRAATRYNNKRLLDFNTPQGDGLDSMFKLGTAGKGDYGASQLNHKLHISEAAFIKPHVAKRLFDTLLQTVPKTPNSEVVFESTANGAGGEYYARYWAARYEYELYLDENRVPQFVFRINKDASPENTYIRIFIPWFVFPEYHAAVPEGFTRTNENSPQELLRVYGDEELLAAAHNLTDAQLYWRRLTIRGECGGSLASFHALYPATAQEAFITSGTPVFDNEKILVLRNTAKEPKVCYTCIYGTGQWTADPNGPLEVWDEPRFDRAYLVSADIAEGLEKGDYHSADVIDHLTGEQVAHWHGKVDPDQFAYVLVDIAKRYNGAIIVPERNNHGHVVIATLVKIIRYPRVYVSKDKTVDGAVQRRYGWLTSSKTKPAIIDNLIKEMREDTHGIRNRDTFDEMLSFIQHPDGHLGAQDGADIYDDRVMSIAIGKYVRRFLPLPAMKTAQYDTVEERKRAMGVPVQGEVDNMAAFV